MPSSPEGFLALRASSPPAFLEAEVAHLSEDTCVSLPFMFLTKAEIVSKLAILVGD